MEQPSYYLAVWCGHLLEMQNEWNCFHVTFTGLWLRMCCKSWRSRCEASSVVKTAKWKCTSSPCKTVSSCKSLKGLWFIISWDKHLLGLSQRIITVMLGADWLAWDHKAYNATSCCSLLCYNSLETLYLKFLKLAIVLWALEARGIPNANPTSWWNLETLK